MYRRSSKQTEKWDKIGRHSESIKIRALNRWQQGREKKREKIVTEQSGDPGFRDK